MAESSTLEALSGFAEAVQDMVTAGLEQSIGRSFACVDACNQAAEKALQAVSIAQSGHRAPYAHDLRALGEQLGAPADCLVALAALTPFHPATFYAHTPPEVADDVVRPVLVSACMAGARLVLHWAREIVIGHDPTRRELGLLGRARHMEQPGSRVG
jgi:hypothetical protein